MGTITGIEWTDRTHNFWYGCKKVSAGCSHCYAEREMNRYGRDFKTVTRAKGFDKPLSWKEPSKIFINSWSDFFIEPADQWRAEAWEIIRQTPQHTYQILTKRPERISYCMPEDANGFFYAPKNVWWGVSIEDQSQIDRWMQLESALHFYGGTCFISAEPLLGPLDLSSIVEEIDIGDEEHSWWTHPPDWVIIGGESGPNCRPMQIEWAYDIVHQCKEAKIPVFVKQLGGWPDKRGNMEEWPEELRVREFPEEARNGRLE